MPADVSAASVSEAGDVPDKDLIRPELVTVRAAGWWTGYPLTGRRLHQLTQHDHEPTYFNKRRIASTWGTPVWSANGLKAYDRGLTLGVGRSVPAMVVDAQMWVAL
jgi:hypothetical protein